MTKAANKVRWTIDVAIAHRERKGASFMDGARDRIFSDVLPVAVWGSKDAFIDKTEMAIRREESPESLTVIQCANGVF